MDLKTKYLGLELEHPLMVGSSPMLDDMDTVRELEDAGAAAMVMRSLFEEQIVAEEMATHEFTAGRSDSSAFAQSFFPDPGSYRFGPHEYLEKLRKVKEAVSVPVIGSLNGVTPGRWLDYAIQMEETGADALELNVYYVATDPTEGGAEVERRALDMVRTVREEVKIPLAVKISPYYSSVARFCHNLVEAGADGLVLFNRFYQPDIDVHELEVKPELTLSFSRVLLVRLRWLAIVSATVDASLAVTGGVTTSLDAIKALMAGANAVQCVTALLQKGPGYLATLKKDLELFLEQKEYEDLAQLQGSMNLSRCPDPSMFERGNYLQILQSWKGHK